MVSSTSAPSPAYFKFLTLGFLQTLHTDPPLHFVQQMVPQFSHFLRIDPVLPPQDGHGVFDVVCGMLSSRFSCSRQLELRPVTVLVLVPPSRSPVRFSK